MHIEHYLRLPICVSRSKVLLLFGFVCGSARVNQQLSTMAAVPKRKLGGVLEVPLLCLGTMTWGEQNTQEEAFEQLDYCLAQGLNFLDTAEMYPVPVNPEISGRTEVIIGNWLAARNNRDQVILATKVSSYLPGVDRSAVVGKRFDPPVQTTIQPNLDRENIRSALAASLRRLQTTYVDLYQLHWPARYVPLWGQRQYRLENERADNVAVEETVAAIGELIAEGKIKHWGLSNETTFGVCKFCETAKRLGVPLPISIQNDYSLTNRRFDSDLAEACSPSNYNISLLPYGVLGGGALSDKYLTPLAEQGAPERARHRLFPGFQGRYHTPQVLAAAKEYAEIAKREGITLAQLAYAWAASRWFMGSVIIGATTLDQIKENIKAFEITLSEQALKDIDTLYLKYQNPQDTD